jgi:tetratricopeptide (TPR) repeat protein
MAAIYLLVLIAPILAADDKGGADKPVFTGSKEVTALVKEGSTYYMKGDYKKAIKPYQKALDLEKKQPSMDSTFTKVLIDNLGMSYGISGDLAKSKEIFEYGISWDSQYPMFYYNLACTYAEMDKIDSSIVYLKKAFQYKDNVILGEEMPDPATDSSFKRYLKEEKFIETLKEIKGNTK